MKEWVKVWTDILGDPKLLRAARAGAKGLDLTPWLFVFAKQANDGGRLTVNGQPVEPEDLSHLIPCTTPARFAACLASLQQLGVLVGDPDGALRFSTWEERQAKPSDSREAVAERMRLYRARKQASCDTSSGDSVTPVTRNEASLSYATEGEEDVTEKGTTPLTPLPDPPTSGGSVALVVHSNGNGNGANRPKGMKLAKRMAVSVPDVQARIVSLMASMREDATRELRIEERRAVMVDLIFAYWANKTGNTDAKVDRKRAGIIRTRLLQAGDNVHQLLYTVDGALKDDQLMGRKNDSSERYVDRVSTIFRDWEQVERLAKLGSYREGKTHPMAIKHLEPILTRVAVGVN